MTKSWLNGKLMTEQDMDNFWNEFIAGNVNLNDVIFEKGKCIHGTDHRSYFLCPECQHKGLDKTR